MDTVPTFMQEIRATVTAILATVKTLDEKIIQSHGHFTKTTLPSLSSRLDILEARATSVPAAIAEEPPLSLPPESNATPPPAALPVVLPSDPPDDTVILTPWVPDRVPDMFAAERVHHIAPPHISLQSHLASPGLTTGNSGNNAPMAEPPDTMANSRVAFAALQARMSGSRRDHWAHRRRKAVPRGRQRGNQSQPPCSVSTCHVRPACYTESFYPLPTLQSIPTTYHSRISLSWWRQYRQ
jgi:hypothetical protein